MALARPLKWVRLALITTVFSVLGGILGYLIGIFLWETIGQYIIGIYHLEENLLILKIIIIQMELSLYSLLDLLPYPIS